MGAPGGKSDQKKHRFRHGDQECTSRDKMMNVPGNKSGNFSRASRKHGGSHCPWPDQRSSYFNLQVLSWECGGGVGGGGSTEFWGFALGPRAQCFGAPGGAGF